MNELDFFLLSLSTVMIAASGYIINDYFDLKIDRVNRPDKIIIGKYFKRRLAMGAHIVINSLAIIIAGYVAYKVGNWKLIFIQLGCVGALWYYSISFKRQVLIGNVVVAILAALVPFVAGLYELILQHNNADDSVNGLMFFVEAGTPFEQVMFEFKIVLSVIMKWVLGFSFFAFLSTMVREIIKDIEDYEGDKKYFSNTLAVIHGKDKAKLVAQLIAVIMILLIGYLQYNQVIVNRGGGTIERVQSQTKALITTMYFLFALQLPLVYLLFKLQKAKEKIDYSKLSMNMKIIMLLGISYIAVFFWLKNYI
jgi:4-hydroxybenzoate polyprenyltransferase